jgi:uncharacterized protein YneR
VLDRVVSHRDQLLALVVFQTAKPVAAALVELVEVADLQVAAELLIGGEAPVGGQIEEMGFEAGQVVTLFAAQGAAEGGEGFLLGVGGDGADSPAEDIGLQQTQGLQQFIAAEQADLMVAVELQ